MILLVLFTVVISLIPLVAASTIDVPGDYPTIQEAIDHASEGDTIRVAPGVYSGDITISWDKQGLSLLGSDKEKTILNLNGSMKRLWIDPDGVEISGFTIHGAIAPASYAHISDNVINGSLFASTYDNGVTYENNIIHGDLWVGGSENSVIENNITFLAVYDKGINNIIRNSIGKLIVHKAPNNNFKDNNISDYIRIYGLELEEYYVTMNSSNLYRGRPTYILTDVNNLTIDSTFYPGAGFLAFINSKNISIRDRDLSNRSLFFGHCADINISNTMFLNSLGIESIYSTNINVENCVFTNNSCGIKMWISTNNTIINNTFQGCNQGIFLLFNVYNVIISNNTFSNALFGVEYESTIDDIFLFFNNFIDNTINVAAHTYPGKKELYWDYGEGFGNFWSDYDGVDSDGDGIGDIPYIIDEENQDNYPLMTPIELTITSIGDDQGTQPPLPPFLSDLTVTPSEIERGDNVTIGLDIMNPNNRSITYIVTIRVEGIGQMGAHIEELTLFVNVELGAYESETVQHTITPDVAGHYNVTVDGMTGSFVVVRPPLPANFVVLDLEASPDEVEEGEYVLFSVLVFNDGDTEGTYTVEFKVDGETFYTQNVTVAADRFHHVRAFYYEAGSPGTYEVSVGDFTETFKVRAPLEPAEFEFSNLSQFISIEEDMDITFFVDVSNVGDIEGTYQVVLILTGGDILFRAEYITDVTLPGGASEEVPLRIHDGLKAGAYQVEVEGLTGSFTVVKPEPSFWDKIPGFPYESIIIGLIAVIIIIWRARNL